MGRKIRPKDLKSQVRSEILVTMLEAEISRGELASRMGVTPQMITNFLEEGHNFTVDTIERISRALNRQFMFNVE